MSELVQDQAGLMSRLRGATARQHEAVESQLNLLRPGVTRDDYSRVLAGFRSILVPWESLVRERLAPSCPSMTAGREKLPLLDDDLRFLKANPPFRTADLSSLDSLESLAGGMYVLEGSTLGGQVLLRHLSPLLDIAPGRGASYFNGYGASTGLMWKAFCREAELFARNRDVEQIVDGARQMFGIVARELPQAVAA